MQLRLQPRGRKTFLTRKLIIKFILFSILFVLAIFLLNKIEISSPNKLIKQELGNDKIITVK